MGAVQESVLRTRARSLGLRYSPSWRVEMNSVARREAQLPQTGADRQSQLLELDKSVEAVSAHLEVGPLLLRLLLLAVDHFFNLLHLIMHLDKLARADKLGVAIFVGGIFEDVRNDGDLVKGASSELVFGLDVTPRYRLAVDLLVARSFDGEGAAVVASCLRMKGPEIRRHHDLMQ